MAKRITGITPDGAGLRIRLFKRGKAIHSETLKGDPTSPGLIAAAKQRRKWLTSRQALGLPLYEGEKADHDVFETVAQDYMNTLEAKRSTHLTYESILNSYWLKFYTGWPIEDITTADIKRRMASFTLAPKTKKNILIPLRGVLQHAEVNPNPVDAITVKRGQKEPVQRYSPGEKKDLLEKLEGQPLVYFSLLFATGLRPGEALALEWADYNGVELVVSKQITRRRLQNSTKTNVRRVVYVPEWVRPTLNQHTTRFKEGYIFLNTQGGPYLDTDVFNLAWHKAHKKARVSYRIPYTCRHTRAAEFLSMGVNPADAAQQLGHSTEIFLRTYSEFMLEYSKEKDYSRFERLTAENAAENKDEK